MEILVTGPSGELGRSTVSGLVQAGHRVRGATRSADAARIVTSLGAEAVPVDLFDAAAVRAAVGGADVVLHLATKIPPSAQMADPAVWEENDRLRTETTSHLAEAVRANGTRALVLQSYFAVQEPRGDEWIENDPARAPAWSGIGVMDSMRAGEELVGALGAGGVVLRFGSLYSATSEQLQAQVEWLRAAAPIVPGPGTNRWPFVSSADAARAVIASVELTSGSYDVVDDTPMALREFFASAAAAVDAPPPAHNDDVGGPMADILLGSWRVSNRPFASATGWRPLDGSTVAGWAREARRYLRDKPRLRPA